MFPFEKMEIETRSESTGLHFFETIIQALEYCNKDPTVWKLSIGSDRWVKKTISEVWNPVSEEKLRSLSAEYKNCKDSKKQFWVLQDMLPIPENRYLPYNERLASCIRNVVPYEGIIYPLKYNNPLAQN